MVASPQLSVLRQLLRFDAAATGLLTDQGKERTRICPRGWISRRLTTAKKYCVPASARRLVTRHAA